MRIALLLIALLLCGRSAFAAVAIDAIGTACSANATSVTCALTVAGANRWLLVDIWINDANVTGVTWDTSQSLTQITRCQVGDSAYFIDRWRLTAPNTGTHNVVASFDLTRRAVVVPVSFTGVDQTTPVGTSVCDAYTGNTSSHAHNTSSVTDGLVWDAFAVANPGITITADAGQTERVAQADDPESLFRYYVTSEPGATTVGTGYSWTGGGTPFERWGHVTTPISPSGGGGGGGSAGYRSLLGVGK